MLHHRLFGVIAKAEVGQLHPQTVLCLFGKDLAPGQTDLLGQLHQLPDAMGGDGGVQEGRDDAHYRLEGGAQTPGLLEKEGHGAVGEIRSEPEPVEAVTEDRHGDDSPGDRHENVGVDRKLVVVQRDLLHLFQTVVQLSAVLIGDAEGLDGVQVVKGLHLKAHHVAAHFAHLLAVVALLADHKAGHQHQNRRRGQGEAGDEQVIVGQHDEGRDEAVE